MGAKHQTDPKSIDLTIEAMGAQGDAIGLDAAGARRFLPFALPGERWRAAPEGPDRARGVDRLAASADRVDPACPHFGVCGGCALQHWADAPYAAWKRAKVAEALARAGFADMPLNPLRRSPPGARRRAVFAARKLRGGVALGFHERRGDRIVDLAACPVLAPPLSALIPALRDVLASWLLAGARAGGSALLTETGVDLLLDLPHTLDREDRVHAVAFAERADLARLSLRVGGDTPEPVIERRRPILGIGQAAVAPPPGGFAQATAEGEAAIAAPVAAALAGAGRIADLFAGFGALGLRLAGGADVTAFDSDNAAVAAGAEAARQAGLRYRAETRDLFRRPLVGKALKGLDAAILDPPRAGAKAQAEALAAYGPPLVAMVSCNPATLARDLAILRGGGYSAQEAHAIDQFLWSPHVEAVVILARR